MTQQRRIKRSELVALVTAGEVSDSMLDDDLELVERVMALTGSKNRQLGVNASSAVHRWCQRTKPALRRRMTKSDPRARLYARFYHKMKLIHRHDPQGVLQKLVRMYPTLASTLVVLLLVGCGDDSGGARHDAAPPDDTNGTIDTPGQDSGTGDAAGVGVNLTHRGLAMVTQNGSGNAALLTGYYEVPTSAPGCTWTFSGACSLVVCASNAGLQARSAGDVTFTVGGATTTLPASTNGPVFINNIAAGTTVTVSAVGADVPAFGSASLVMPSAVTVSAPADNATVDRTQPLGLAWTAASNYVYANITQSQGANLAYPEGEGNVIRCLFPASTGSATIPVEVLAGLDAGSATMVIAGAIEQRITSGMFDVTVRLAPYDQTRGLSVQ